MRLTDVDALGVSRCSKDVLPAAYCAGWNGLLNLLQAAPTVDAVPVVRCGNCKHIRPEVDAYTGETVGYWCSELDIDSVDVDDFCSYGERREDTDG